MAGSSVLKEFAFGRFVAQPATRLLLVDGQPAKLGARAFDLLITLADRRDRVVSKNELLDVVWPGLVVEENNLQVHISALRKLLGPSVIATIPGRGYRFAAPLEGAANDDRPAATTLPAPATAASRPQGNFPAPDEALYGRDKELAALCSLLAGHRLVTIAGAGGIGKTRLALAAAWRAQPDFPDGAWLVAGTKKSRCDPRAHERRRDCRPAYLPNSPWLSGAVQSRWSGLTPSGLVRSRSIKRFEVNSLYLYWCASG